jgi:protein-S-isoprenylcysteine O-methyltransferase Ste14
MSGMVSAMLWLVRDYWQSFAAFCVFALFHSFGAREPFKNALARWTSPFFVAHFWRLFYCLISILWYYEFIGMLHWGLHPDNDFWLMDYPDGLWQTITAIHLGSIALIYAAFLQSDYLEFMGLKQAWRGGMAWLGLPQPRLFLKQFGTQRLEIHGIYGWMRHPMLAGGLLFLMTNRPSLNNLAIVPMYGLYMFIGGHYEERRLIQIFGEDYLSYRNQVGAFFPRLWYRRPIQERN